MSAGVPGGAQSGAGLQATFASVPVPPGFESGVLDSMAAGVSVAGEDGIIVYANAAEERLFGCRRGELIGLHVNARSAYPPAEDSRRFQEVIEALKSSGAWTGEWLNRRNDGTAFSTSVRITVSEIGGRRYWIRVQDEMAQGRLEDACEHRGAPVEPSERQARLVIDALPGLVSYLDTDLRYRFINRAYAEWFRKPSEYFAGKTMRDLAPGRAFEELEPYVKRVLAGETVTFETSLAYAEGDVRHVRATYVPDRSPAGSVRGFVVVVEDLTSAKAGEEALRYNEQRYRALVEASAQFVWSADGNGFTSGEKSSWWMGLTGQSQTESAGWGWLNRLHPDDRERSRDAWMRAVTHKQPFQAEYRVLTRENVYRDFLLRGVPMWNEDGSFHEWVGTATDISDRRRAEAAQRDIERQLTLLIEASSALLASPEAGHVLKTILEIASRFVEADAYSVWRREPEGDVWRIAAMRGLSDSYGQQVSDSARGSVTLLNEPIVIEDVERGPFHQERREAYRREGIRSMLTVPLRIHGTMTGTIVLYYRTPHHFSELETRVAAALGNLAAAALGTADLYERETKLRQRAESEERKATFLAGVGQVLASSLDYEATLSAVVEMAVPSFADWAAVRVLDDSGELKRVAVKHHDPARIAVADEYARRFPPEPGDADQEVMRNGQSVLVEEVSDDLIAARARSPEHLQFIRDLGLKSLMLLPLMSGGKGCGVLSFVMAESGRRYTADDLRLAEELARRVSTAVENARLFTESARVQAALRRSNEELQRANEDLDQFAHSASHDLQEPLRMVTIYCQMLERNYRNRLDSDAQQFLQFAVQGAKRMELLIKDLLEYTQAVNISARAAGFVDSERVLKKTILNLKAGIDESKATVEFAALPTLAMQEIHLLQLFQNLLSNAIKYRGPEAPVIRVSARREGSQWEFAVADNGIGIAPQHRAQVFGLFKRLHSADRYPGTGIGLAICQKIVHRYGGRIWVESNRGQGSTFRFTLPAVELAELKPGVEASE